MGAIVVSWELNPRFVILSGESAHQCGFAVEGPCGFPRHTARYPSSQKCSRAPTDHGGMRDHTYYVYILTNASRRSLYIGVTNALKARVRQHKERAHEGFTSKYNVDRLVYYEAFQFIHAAIAREKQLKGWTRAKKLALILRLNPQFRDLSAVWFEHHAVEVHTFGDHVANGGPQDASTANPESSPDSPLSMTGTEGSE
jgi:putative endonuclease